MKRTIMGLLAIVFVHTLCAQKMIEKTWKVKSGQQILLKFDFPKVKISSWDKNEIYIKAIVNISDNKQNDLFSLADKTTSAGELVISDNIDFKKVIPVYYVETDGVKKRFDNKQDFENYKKNHQGEQFSYYQSNHTDITIELMLPARENSKVASKFGLVEISDYSGPLTVETEFGKIDAKLSQVDVGMVKLTNEFGKIYSDFTMTPTNKEERNFYTSITASPGQGPAYSLRSKFGNIYLRDRKP